MKFCILPFAVATLATGCITVPAKATADGTLICVFPQPGGSSFCQAATNLTPKEVTSQTSLCTSMEGTVVSACPAGAVGCCLATSGSVEFDQCFYDTSAATEENACAAKMGTWTGGSTTSDAGATE
jgi:hypothetical protein